MIYKVITIRKEPQASYTEYNCRDYGRALETFDMYVGWKGDVEFVALVYLNEHTSVGKVEKVWKCTHVK